MVAGPGVRNLSTQPGVTSSDCTIELRLRHLRENVPQVSLYLKRPPHTLRCYGPSVSASDFRVHLVYKNYRFSPFFRVHYSATRYLYVVEIALFKLRFHGDNTGSNLVGDAN
jgi:hypothetical protein